MVQQPELSTYTAKNEVTEIDRYRVFDPVCLLDHEYRFEHYPGYYFIVRKDIACNDVECERVCLYKEGVVNKYLVLDRPFTLWISNELRNNRRIERIYRDVEEKIKQHLLRISFIK